MNNSLARELFETLGNDPYIRPLDYLLIHRANSNSMGGTRGDSHNRSYLSYANEILEWDIPVSRKQKLLDDLHKRYSEIMKYDAQHVSVMVAGPARYNARKLDKSDQVLSLSHELAEWFKNVKEQVLSGKKETVDKEALIKRILFCDETKELDPTVVLAKLATVDNAKFIELYEQMYEKYRWRKNSGIAKLYENSKKGEIKEIRREEVFSDDNITAYTFEDRVFIKYILFPKPQMVKALRSRRWWWNDRERAYSNYPDRVDWEWVRSISERYAKYL